MTNLEVLRSKVRELEKYLLLIKKYQRYSQEALFNDPTLKGAVERYLYLICQSAIDLGEALIAYFNLDVPSTYAEVFEILEQKGIISRKISLNMRRMVGFRNILAHAYGKINFDIVYQVLKKDIAKVTVFAKIIRSKMKI